MQSQNEPIIIGINTIQYDENKIKTKSITTRNAIYKILQYDGNVVCESDDATGLYRSVVIDPSTNNILSYSPNKSIEFERFTKTHKDTSVLWVNEATEGTMINLFYDPRIPGWEIATRGGVGGNYWFYRLEYNVEPAISEKIPGNDKKSHMLDVSKKQKTFRAMFIECFRGDIPKNAVGVMDNVGLESAIPFLESLNKNFSYCFVMQHPDNHIVYSIRSPRLVLVSVFEIMNDWRINDIERGNASRGDDDFIKKVRVVPSYEYESWGVFSNISGIIDFPKKYDVEQYIRYANELEDSAMEPLSKVSEPVINNALLNNSYPMGLMVTDMNTGERTCIDNKIYLKLKELRGNNPNLQYHYFALYRIGKVNDFLRYFPMYKKQFYRFYEQYHLFITNVHNAYVSYYILKKPEKISKKYFIHVSKIHHDIYLPSLNKKNKIYTADDMETESQSPPKTRMIITHRVVREYFDKMEPREILYYVNYDLRNEVVAKSESKNEVELNAQMCDMNLG